MSMLLDLPLQIVDNSAQHNAPCSFGKIPCLTLAHYFILFVFSLAPTRYQLKESKKERIWQEKPRHKVIEEMTMRKWELQQNVDNSNFEGKPTQIFLNVLTKRHLEVLGG